MRECRPGTVTLDELEGAAVPHDDRLDTRVVRDGERLCSAAGLAHDRDRRGIKPLEVLAVLSVVFRCCPIQRRRQILRLRLWEVRAAAALGIASRAGKRDNRESFFLGERDEIRRPVDCVFGNSRIFLHHHSVGPARVLPIWWLGGGISGLGEHRSGNNR